jgi:WD40 repeat protein
MSWTPDGSLIATGSNDKTVKLMKFNAETSNLEGQEIELAMHDGTVRDVCFIEDTTNRSSLLISGGAGDCKIYVTDCETGQPYQALSGHSGSYIKIWEITIISQKITAAAVCGKTLENYHHRFFLSRSHIIPIQLGWSHVRKRKP